MALILILDRADTGRWRRPRVHAVINDGYVLFTEIQMDEVTRGIRVDMSDDGVDLATLAQGLVAMGVGDQMRSEIVAQMQRAAAAREHEEIKAKWDALKHEDDRQRTDGGPAGGAAGED